MIRDCSLVMMLAALGAASGCLDFTPVTVVSDAAIVVRDASTQPSDADGEAQPDPPCLACIKSPNVPGPGCANELAACDATAKCRFIFDCAYENGCVTKPMQSESIACALPCGDQLGTSAFEASILSALTLTTCFHMACAAACEGDQ